MSLLHTIVLLDKTEILETELETNTILKPHSHCEDYAAESPVNVAEFNFHDKSIGLIEGKDFSACKKIIQLLVLAAKRANITYSPSKGHIHDRISEDSEKQASCLK